MSMFTECFITKVSIPATDGTSSPITVAVEPAQKYQVELDGVKYCLFVSGETKKGGKEKVKKSGEENENSQKDGRTAVLKQIDKCQWNRMSLSCICARTLIQAKLSKARVKLFTDKDFKKLERVELI